MNDDKSPYRKNLNIRDEISYLARVWNRGEVKNFGILQDDRRRHTYIVGKTGMGKSTLLTNMVLQDIHNGHGVCFIDPHGDAVEYILDRIPPERHEDVIYFNPADIEAPIGFNILEAQNEEEVFLLASGMMAVFKRIWSGMWSSRMEYILNNTLLALLEQPGNTLLDVVRMLTDNEYKDEIVAAVEDPMVKNFWLKEFAAFNDKYRTEAIAPILNKIGQFFSTDLVRDILGQSKSTINIREIMDGKKIFLVNLSKGRLGEDNSSLLGSLLVTKIQLAAMSRVDIPEEERSDFYLYVDEFQNFISDTFATILSEARKYRLNLVIAHQYISQLVESDNYKVKNAIFGNVGTIISFRVGAVDGEELEKEFEPNFKAHHLVDLAKYQVAIKMIINGKAMMPFLASTIPPLYDDASGQGPTVEEASRFKYSRDRKTVKAEISERIAPKILDTDSDKKKKKKRKAVIALQNTKEDIKNKNQHAPKFDTLKTGDLSNDYKYNTPHKIHKPSDRLTQISDAAKKKEDPNGNLTKLKDKYVARKPDIKVDPKQTNQFPSFDAEEAPSIGFDYNSKPKKLSAIDRLKNGS